MGYDPAMTHTLRSFIAVAMLLAASPALAQQGTLASDLQQDWDRQRETIVNAVDAMPADKFTFKATEPQRDFGGHAMHIVEINQMLLATLGGKTPAPSINLKATSKADILTALRQSFDYGAAVLKEFNDEQLVARIAPPPFLGPSMSRVGVLSFLGQHTMDTYGQIVVYLRLNGVVPPASRRGGV
jgi:uncharacterized damage-inducible protein DinB